MIHPHAQGTPADARLTYEMIDPRHHAMVASILALPKVGFGCLKLENGLDHAVGLMFNLERHGVHFGGRRRCVADVCRMAGNAEASAVICGTAEVVASGLGQLHFPVNGLGVEVTRRQVREIKSYIRTDKAHEYVEDGQIRGLNPTAAQELAVAEAAIEFARPDRVIAALTMISNLHATGCAFEMLGVDIHGEDVEIKLYFQARIPEGRYQAPFTADAAKRAISVALKCCGMAALESSAHGFIDGLSALGLPCNQIGIDLKPDGRNEVKVSFDTWRLSSLARSIVVDRGTAEQAMSILYANAGHDFEGAAHARLMDRAYGSGMIIDSFTTDFSNGVCGAKTYLRSGFDIGEGVVLPAPLGLAS